MLHDNINNHNNKVYEVKEQKLGKWWHRNSNHEAASEKISQVYVIFIFKWIDFHFHCK